MSNHLSTEPVEQAFGDFETLVYVDDWKGGESGRDDSPVFFAGRRFSRNDVQELSEFYEILGGAKSESWHASKGRRNLFTSKIYTPVVSILDRLETSLDSQLTSFEDYFSGPLEVGWTELLKSERGFDEVFSPRDAYGRGLVRFLSHVAGWVEEEKPGASRTRIIVDTMPQILIKQRRFKEVEPGIVHLMTIPGKVEARVDCVVDKDDRHARRHLRFLGLIDSEVWAFGRMQTRVLPDGSTVRERCRTQQAAGKFDEVWFDANDVRSIEDGAANANLVDYWNRWSHWFAEGRVRAT